MDWRAKSQSRSRSRAPDTMDWRAQSRSRSRAPDFRVAVAPPTVDVATATANFSRFYGDGSGTTTPSGSTSASSSTPNTTAQDSRSAHVQLAASLGLSPNPVDSYGSQNGFSQSSLSSLAVTSASPPQPPFSSTTSPATSALALSGAGSPGTLNTYSSSQGSYNNSYVSSPSFSFPHPSVSTEQSSGADPNLTAIENTLNQLINLQSLASNGSSQSTSPAASLGRGTTFISSSSEGVSNSKPSSSDYPFMPPPPARKANQESYASLAQQQLQQHLASVSSSDLPFRRT